MAPQKKRKAAESLASPAASKKKQKINDTKKAPATRLTRSTSGNAANEDLSAKISSPGKVGRPKKSPAIQTKKTPEPVTKAPTASTDEEEQPKPPMSVALTPKKSKPKAKKNDTDDSENEANTDGHQYWLMKAEPESRIEKGKDVKFSIDDLQAASSPEPWDGVRNLEARNNMRAMSKGDLAFFYHSNCKVPGIVGIMEIVEEHSVDESAFDKEHLYYDEKSSRESPKWHVVHVAFKQKFSEMISLKELQKFSKEGGILENMQTLRRTRLSVSKVSKTEWDFVLSLVDENEGDAAASIPQAEDAKEQKSNGISHTAADLIEATKEDGTTT